VTRSGFNELTHYFISDGVACTEKVRFKPFLGIHAMKSEKTNWTDIHGKPTKVMVFDDMSECDKWKKENKDVLEILGNIQYPIQFIATQYRDDITIQKDGLKILNLDIEVFCKIGFPRPEKAEHEINAVTLHEMIKDVYHVFGCHNYIPESDNVKYYKCNDEIDLITQLLDFLEEYQPHILTGWNIELFDIPYIVNRVNRLFPKGEILRISPERKMRDHKRTSKHGQESITYSFDGIITWDYFDLYAKYQPEPRESYTLDYISKYELGEEKVKFKEEHDNLSSLYENDFKKFLDYNIQDTTLIANLEKKLGYIDLALSIMYKAKCTPDSIFATVAPWDALFYNELLKQKKLCPEQKHYGKQEFVGGYCKEPEKGYHKWIMVYDIVSSYPNQIRSFNISPETIINDNMLPDDLKRVKQEFNTIEKCADTEKLIKIKPILQKYNVSFTSNGYFYRNDIEGFIPSIYTKLFNYRLLLKKQLKEAKKAGKKDEAARLDTAQYTIKILLNSGYGALSNIYCRYFDIRMAEAITSNGQCCAIGAANYIVKNVPMFENRYQDTDSVFGSVEKMVLKRFGKSTPTTKEVLDFLIKVDKNIIEPKIKEFFNIMKENMNMRELTLGMEAECIADTSIFTGKKRYILRKIWEEGVTLPEPKLKIRGIEIVRTSTPQWVRNKLKDTVSFLFNGTTNDLMIKYIEQIEKEFKQLTCEDVAFSISCNYNNYESDSKGLPIQVRSAYKFNEALEKLQLTDKYQKIFDGNKIKYLYIKKPNFVQSDIIGFPEKMPKEISNKIEIDYKTQFQKTYMAAINRILTPIGWSSVKTNSLDDFFS
jgi:DNA polymerase elongation subunit (family B)